MKLNEPSVEPTVTETPITESAAESEPPVVSETEAPLPALPQAPTTQQHAPGKHSPVAHFARTTCTSISRLAVDVARYAGRALRLGWRAFEAVSPAMKLLTVAGTMTLLGVVGAISFNNALGVLCIVLIVPVCAGVLGALGYHTYHRGSAAPAGKPSVDAADLQRSVEYVDRKLGLALNSLGTEHHQQAVIALFQAKTAVELTLGTEQDAVSYLDLSLRADDYGSLARIHGGAGSASPLREGNSLAAS